MSGLDLVRLSDELIADRRWTSCYGDGTIPSRMRWLRAECAASLPPDLVFSDLFRSPASSLEAVARGRGALPPGYSCHNFGGAVDLDVDATMRRLGYTKKRLDEYMAAAGWYCHRSDHKRGSEDWHWNYLPSPPSGRLSSDEAERHLVDLYEAQWSALRSDLHAEQTALAALGLYRGAIDGIVGKQTRSARAAFSSAWLTRPTADYYRVLWLAAQAKRYEE